MPNAPVPAAATGLPAPPLDHLGAVELLGVFDAARRITDVLNDVLDQPRCTGDVQDLFNPIMRRADALARAAAEAADRRFPADNIEARCLYELGVRWLMEGDEWDRVKAYAEAAALWFTKAPGAAHV